MAKIAIVMGSDSDSPTMSEATKILDTLGVAYDYTIVSAHRTPHKMYEFAENAHKNGVKVIIAGAGGAAHLPGMIAAISPLPVIGVPVQSKTLSGWDSLLSIVQMPGGVPVGNRRLRSAPQRDPAGPHRDRLCPGPDGREQPSSGHDPDRGRFLGLLQVADRLDPVRSHRVQPCDAGVVGASRARTAGPPAQLNADARTQIKRTVRSGHARPFILVCTPACRPGVRDMADDRWTTDGSAALSRSTCRETNP